MATVSAFAFAVCLHNGFEGFKDLTALGVRPRIGVYTFGSPKCGNPEFTQVRPTPGAPNQSRDNPAPIARPVRS